MNRPIRRAMAGAVIALGMLGATALPAGAAPSRAALVQPGQFCKTADLGKVVKAENGKTVKCQHVDGYNRWVVK